METHIVAPIPGKDYPQNWNDFLDWFATEEAQVASRNKRTKPTKRKGKSKT